MMTAEERIRRAKERLKRAALGVVTFTLLASSTLKPNMSSENSEIRKQAVAAKLAKIPEQHTAKDNDELLESAKKDLQMGLARPTRLNELAQFVEENYTFEMGPDNYTYAPESIELDSKDISPNSDDFGVREMVGLELNLMKYTDGGSLLEISYTDTNSGKYESLMCIVNESASALAEMRNQCPEDLSEEQKASTRSLAFAIGDDGRSYSGFDEQERNIWQKGPDGKIAIISHDERNNHDTKQRSGTLQVTPDMLNLKVR